MFSDIRKLPSLNPKKNCGIINAIKKQAVRFAYLIMVFTSLTSATVHEFACGEVENWKEQSENNGDNNGRNYHD